MKERNNSLLRFADRYIGIPLINVLATFKKKRNKPETINRIGLISLGAIGDFILSAGAAIPALAQTYPGAEIVVFTSAANKNALALVPANVTLVVLPISDVLTSIKLLRSFQCDVLIDLCTWPRIGAVYAATSGARFTIGFNVPHQYRHRAFDVVVDHRADRHEAENYVALLRAAGVPSLARPALTPTPAAVAKISGLDLAPYLVFHPWASGVRKTMREWPSENWRDLARRATERGFIVLFTGGPGDTADSTDLVAELQRENSRVRDMARTLSLGETAALLQGATAAVSVNTGIMHLAAALDTPLVALHGPTNPKRWGPLSDRATVLIPDAPNVAYLNLGFEYPPGVEPCMQLLTVDEVDRALSEAIRVGRN